jgi:hypothetical protein
VQCGRCLSTFPRNVLLPSSGIGSTSLRNVSKHYQIFHTYFFVGGWDSAVGIATGYGLDDREVGVRVPVGSRIFSSARSGAHPASYPMGTGGSFSGGKAAGA